MKPGDPLPMDRPTFVDIDGTLTRLPNAPWGEVIGARVEILQQIIANGLPVVLWTGGGTTYAKAFAELNGLSGAVCIGKPDLVVDDNPTIRPNFADLILPPEQFFNGA